MSNAPCARRRVCRTAERISLLRTALSWSGQVHFGISASAAPVERFLGAHEERFEAANGYLRRSLGRAVYRYLD